MSTTKDLAALGRLVAVHHGWTAAKAFKAYQMDDAARAKVSALALDILKVCAPVAQDSALISAAFAVGLETGLDAPIQVVAGTLSINGAPVFEDRSPLRADAFSGSERSWKGHVWVMIGPYIADIAIFRAAYSRAGPAVLSRHVDLTFGPNKGLYVDLWAKTQKVGLKYEPSHVLSREDVNTLMARAYHTIQEQSLQR